tara:strand:+ start:160 stop:357 length:198 start_codon:yes stop_codon:yes gene_type:complete
MTVSTMIKNTVSARLSVFVIYLTRYGLTDLLELIVVMRFPKKRLLIRNTDKIMSAIKIFIADNPL